MTKKIHQINRRSFISQIGYGMGILGFISTASPFATLISSDNSDKSPIKKLFATTDYNDNLIVNLKGTRYGKAKVRTDDFYDNYQYFMDRSQLDDLHKCLASIGVTRHQWIFNPIWSLYENYPHNFNLLAEAADSAHAQGIEFYTIIKPIENGGTGAGLPHTMPFSEDMAAFKDIRVIFPRAVPFAAKYPHMNLKCKPGTYKFTGKITAICLVKGNDNPTRIKAEHLSVWTSTTNNGFEPYNGSISFRETIEWRFRFPKWRQCRIIYLERLEIPDNHNYFMVKCGLADNKGDFGNQCGSILELIGSSGKVIPHTLSTGPVSLENHNNSLYRSPMWNKVSRYLQRAEVQEEINSPHKMEAHYKNFYGFGDYKLTDSKVLDKDGYIVAVCGKPEYMLGNLHPVYPEVRAHWLSLTKYCLDQGVDGINFRVANHTRLPECWEYGFNEPVLEASAGKTDYPRICRINGNAYTQFLREARELIKSRGKGITIHLHPEMLMPDDRGRLPSLPPNFEWQWETWVREIGDEFHFRGAWTLRPWNLNKALDIFSVATRAVNKPLYFQGDFHGMTFDGPFPQTKAEVGLVKNHSGLDGLILYETAYYTMLNNDGSIEMSPLMENLIKKHYFQNNL